jgi:hypothetical protein
MRYHTSTKTQCQRNARNICGGILCAALHCTVVNRGAVVSHTHTFTIAVPKMAYMMHWTRTRRKSTRPPHKNQPSTKAQSNQSFPHNRTKHVTTLHQPLTFQLQVKPATPCNVKEAPTPQSHSLVTQHLHPPASPNAHPHVAYSLHFTSHRCLRLPANLVERALNQRTSHGTA